MAPGLVDEIRIELVEVTKHLVERQVVVTAPLADVLHVSAAGLVVGMHQRVGGAVEVEHLDTESLT